MRSDSTTPPPADDMSFMFMFSEFWKNPIITTNKKEDLNSINLGESCFESRVEDDNSFSTYDNVLFSGARYTKDTLISKENKLLDKFKENFEGHQHTYQCDTDEEKEEQPCGEDKCEQVCGCYELDQDITLTDNNGDVIDRYH